jgi:hypothetical protein
MALHGSIMLNEHRIGYYSITRGKTVQHSPREYSYKFTVKIVDQLWREKVSEGIVTHFYEEGAIELIAKVFRVASDQEMHYDDEEEPYDPWRNSSGSDPGAA